MENNIELEKTIVITKINRKTKARHFKDVKVGDTLKLVYTLEDTTGASGGGIYASYIKIFKNGDYLFYNSANQLIRNLWCFEYELWEPSNKGSEEQ